MSRDMLESIALVRNWKIVSWRLFFESLIIEEDDQVEYF